MSDHTNPWREAGTQQATAVWTSANNKKKANAIAVPLHDLVALIRDWTADNFKQLEDDNLQPTDTLPKAESVKNHHCYIAIEEALGSVRKDDDIFNISKLIAIPETWQTVRIKNITRDATFQKAFVTLF